MRKIVLCVVLVMACVSSAFGDATDELFKAAKGRNTTPRMIQNLVKFGADVNAENKDGWTALIFATRYSTNPDVVKALIDAGADVNAKDKNGGTVLMIAALENGNPEVLKVLIDAEADIFTKDRESKAVLDYAQSDEVKRLILNTAQ